MQKARGTVMNRLGTQSTQQFARIDFVSQHNGKPYDRPLPASISGVNSSNPGIKKRTGVIPKRKPKKLPVKLGGVLFSGLNRIKTIPTLDPPPMVCFNCWQDSHTMKTCTRPVVSKMCINCGRRGVDVATCPRCYLRYKSYLAYMRGEKLDEREVQLMFGSNRVRNSRNGSSETQMVYNDKQPLDDDCDDVVRQLIDEDNKDRQVDNYYDGDEHEREASYMDTRMKYVETEPRVKYVETREYVKNPVSRHRGDDDEDEEREESFRRHEHEDYEYEDRERSYDDRGGEEYPRYRNRDSSVDRSEERYNRRENSASFDLDSDPVQEVLELAKSIAHLSSETQELIMRQVMAERKEKARLRAMQRGLEESWP